MADVPNPLKMLRPANGNGEPEQLAQLPPPAPPRVFATRPAVRGGRVRRLARQAWTRLAQLPRHPEAPGVFVAIVLACAITAGVWYAIATTPTPWAVPPRPAAQPEAVISAEIIKELNR